MTERREELERSGADVTDAVRRESIESGSETEPQVLEREVKFSQPDAGLADAGAPSSDAALLASDVVENLKAKWSEIQTSFVDEPRRAVQQADGLVTETIQGLAQRFGSERARLEAQWDRGGDVSTEDLRLALQRYREFFSRLLTV